MLGVIQIKKDSGTETKELEMSHRGCLLEGEEAVAEENQVRTRY